MSAGYSRKHPRAAEPCVEGPGSADDVFDLDIPSPPRHQWVRSGNASLFRTATIVFPVVVPSSEGAAMLTASQVLSTPPRNNAHHSQFTPSGAPGRQPII
jgi:hypothetical protein